jgi:4-methylaminobutanoate oxidase (formaldehyde-forming)
MSSPANHAGAEVIVIGGGVGGCSAAYHLTASGVKDVLLLERGSLGSGTTSHSTGNLETYRDDPLIFSMVRYAVESFPRLQSESGQNVGWRNVGRVMYTDRAERMELLRTLPELGRIRGIEIELLSARQVGQRLAVIDPSEILGGIWVPSDGRVDPTNLAIAYARAAKARGVRIRAQTAVLEIAVRDGQVRGVVTANGTVECNTVVVAAGLWSSHIVASCGVRLPLYALEHQYLITKPIEGLDRNMPLFLSYDDQLYGREEVGGLMVGSFDNDAIPVRVSDLPVSFSNALLNERWEQFGPYLMTAMRRFPVLRTAGVKMLLNGPESFTADGQMLLGPVPGVQGLYCACGFNSNGIALSPAAGKFIAEWIVEGAPSADVSRLDVRRFGACVAAEAFMRERVTEVPSYYCKIHSPVDDYRTSRNIRLSPVHATLAAVGAHFASVNGWERPAWIGTSEGPQAWLETVASEAAAAVEGALAVDRSTDVKIALLGRGVSDWLAEHVAGYKAHAESIAQVVAFPSPSGHAQAFGRIMPWDGGFLLTAGPEQEARLTEWLRTAPIPDSIRTYEVSAELALFEIDGPRVADMLLALLDAPNTRSTLPATISHWVGAIRVRIVVDPRHASTLLIAPADGAVYVLKRLMAVGAGFGLRLGGFYAQEAKRIELGIPRFAQDVTPFDQVSSIFGHQSGLAGKRVGASRRGPPSLNEPRMLVGIAASGVVSGFGTYEAVVVGDRVVGELTSRAWIPGWPETLGRAVVCREEVTSPSLAFVAHGKRWPLRRRPTRWEVAIGLEANS